MSRPCRAFHLDEAEDEARLWLHGIGGGGSGRPATASLGDWHEPRAVASATVRRVALRRDGSIGRNDERQSLAASSNAGYLMGDVVDAGVETEMPAMVVVEQRDLLSKFCDWPATRSRLSSIIICAPRTTEHNTSLPSSIAFTHLKT